MLDRAYRQRELAHKSPATRRMYDRFLSRLAAVNNNLEKYMPSGIEVDGISFNELALVNRPEHAAVLDRIFTSWSLIESSITALLGLLFIVRRGYGIPPNPRSHTPNLTPKFRGCPGLTRDFRKQKTRVSARLDAGFGTSGYYLKLVFGGCRTRLVIQFLADTVLHVAPGQICTNKNTNKKLCHSGSMPASDISQKLKHAATQVPNVQLMEYDLPVALRPAALHR